MGIREKFNGLRNKSERKIEPLAKTELEPDETVSLDLSEPIPEDSLGLAKKLYPYGKLVGIIDAGGKYFGLLDVRTDSEHFLKERADFLLIDDSFNLQRLQSEGSETGMLAVRKFEPPVQIGRSHYQDKFEYVPSTSGSHFEVSFADGLLRIHDLESLNKTILFTKKPPRHEVDIMGGRTILAVERSKRTVSYGPPTPEAPYGTYMNHPMIGKDSKNLENGVYLGGGSREAILVDGNSEVLKKSYESLYAKLLKMDVISQTDLLNMVNQHVQAVMPYDGDKVMDITQDYNGDKIIGLSEFVQQKAGVCRHQALMAGYIMQELQKAGFLQGEVRVQRNTVPDFGGTHAWALFIDRNGKEFVIDPAQDFTGTKEQARNLPGRWDYYLAAPEKPAI